MIPSRILSLAPRIRDADAADTEEATKARLVSSMAPTYQGLIAESTRPIKP